MNFILDKSDLKTYFTIGSSSMSWGSWIFKEATWDGTEDLSQRSFDDTNRSRFAFSFQVQLSRLKSVLNRFWNCIESFRVDLSVYLGDIGINDLDHFGFREDIEIGQKGATWLQVYHDDSTLTNSEYISLFLFCRTPIQEVRLFWILWTLINASAVSWSFLAVFTLTLACLCGNAVLNDRDLVIFLGHDTFASLSMSARSDLLLLVYTCFQYSRP